MWTTPGPCPWSGDSGWVSAFPQGATLGQKDGVYGVPLNLRKILLLEFPDNGMGG